MLQLEIYLSSWNNYNSGNLNGQWITLPMPELQLNNLLQSKIFGEDPEYTIQDVDVKLDNKTDTNTVNAFSEVITNSDIRVLNAMIKELNSEYPEQVVAFLALFEKHVNTLEEAMAIVREKKPRVLVGKTFSDLAFEAAHTGDISTAKLLDFVDYDKLGENIFDEDPDYAETDHGVLVF